MKESKIKKEYLDVDYLDAVNGSETTDTKKIKKEKRKSRDDSCLSSTFLDELPNKKIKKEDVFTADATDVTTKKKKSKKHKE